MCGFMAVMTPRQTWRREALRKAVATLDHRGPDAHGIWQDSTQTIGLAHARLSIIDLEGGQQPLSGPRGDTWAIVNGELYDFERQRAQLAAAGYPFKTNSDSEVLLALYEHYGPHCVQHLRGEFAFVLWDERRRWLFAGRDRFGIKPLFYYEKGSAIYLASEVKAFLGLGLELGWDHDGVLQELTGFPQNNRSLFAGVRQVPPAHTLIKAYDGELAELRPYWDLSYPSGATLAADTRSEQELIVGFREVFDEAVRLRLRADVPVASYLSGGLDSCSILGSVKAITGRAIPAFTLCFEAGDYSERQQAEEMAAFTDSPFHPIPIGQDDLADHFAATVWHGEKALINGHAVAKFILSAAVREAGIKVVLTGEGSDEIFAGYAHFRQDQLTAGNLGLDAGERAAALDQLAAANKVSAGFLMADSTLAAEGIIKANLGFVPAWMQSFTTLGDLARSLFSTNFHSATAGRDTAEAFFALTAPMASLKGIDPLNQSLYLWSRGMLPHYLLTILGDRMEMAHSVEGRLPFLDHKVVEYMSQVPVTYKIRGMTEKYLLRQAMRERLTDTMYKRQKHPFLAPPSIGRPQERMGSLLHDLLRGQAFRELPFFDQSAVVKVLDSFASMPLAKQNAFDAVRHMMASLVVIGEKFKL